MDRLHGILQWGWGALQYSMEFCSEGGEHSNTCISDHLENVQGWWGLCGWFADELSHCCNFGVLCVFFICICLSPGSKICTILSRISLATGSKSALICRIGFVDLSCNYLIVLTVLTIPGTRLRIRLSESYPVFCVKICKCVVLALVSLHLLWMIVHSDHCISDMINAEASSIELMPFLGSQRAQVMTRQMWTLHFRLLFLWHSNQVQYIRNEQLCDSPQGVLFWGKSTWKWYVKR